MYILKFGFKPMRSKRSHDTSDIAKSLDADGVFPIDGFADFHPRIHEKEKAVEFEGKNN